MAATSDFPTQEHLAEDTLASAIHALTVGNPSFDQILWDANRHVLSFRRSGIGDYINLWLTDRSHDAGQHRSERNGGPAADSEVLWEEGRWIKVNGRRRFEFTVPPDIREGATVTDGPTQQAFVLGQHDLYGILSGRVRAIRTQLDDGDDLTDVLVSETRLILDSTMTREQIASGLVSVMVRVAQGEDLLASGAGVVQPALVGGLPISIRRGGIRYPIPDEQACVCSPLERLGDSRHECGGSKAGG